jgi:hypothetical protein
MAIEDELRDRLGVRRRKCILCPFRANEPGINDYGARSEAVFASDKARYRAVFPTFTLVAASRTVRPLASNPLARMSLSDVTTGFRPP